MAIAVRRRFPNRVKEFVIVTILRGCKWLTKCAVEENWIIQFPQGTTTPFAPGRKGTAHLIKMHRPIVVPIVIDGFSTAFDKKGIKLRKRGTLLSVTFKESLKVDYDAPIEEILDDVMTAIGQKRL